MGTLPSSSESDATEIQQQSGTSNGCLRVRESFWHPVSNPDFACVGILHDMLSERVNHRLLRKNLAHLNNTSTVTAVRERSYAKKCVREQVPKKLHWIWFGSELPEKYVSNIEASALSNPGWEIFLWSELPSRQLEERLHKHGIQCSFKNISSYLEGGLFVNGDLIQREKIAAGKSDYLRLEVVYIEGGIYQDTDAHSVLGFDDLGDLFRWPFAAFYPDGYHKGTISNGVFGFEKGSAFLSFALNLTRENCLAFQRCGVMIGAGPAFLTAALYYFDDPDIVLLHSDYLLVRSAKSVTFQDNDATWVAPYLDSNGGYW